MRRADKQITNTTEIEAIISSSEICHLSMVDDGRPYVIAMNFGYDDSALYFHSAAEGRKIDVLRKNPDVCFSVVGRYDLVRSDKACSWSAKFSSVIGTGTAHILTDREEIEKGLTILMSQYSDKEFDFPGEDLTGIVVIRVDVEEMKGKKS